MKILNNAIKKLTGPPYMKGQVDLIWLMGSLFLVVIALFAVDAIWGGFTHNAAFNHAANATSTGKLVVQQVSTSFDIINNAVIFVFIIGALASAIAAAFTESSAVFIVPGIIILPAEMMFAFIFHDAFFAIVKGSLFAGIANSYPIIVTGFQALPVIAFAAWIVLIVATFSK